MENSQLFDFESGIFQWLNRIKHVEDLASNISAEVNDLELEIRLRHNFQKDIDDFNIERDDFAIYCNIQRDGDTEAYINQLENTMEVIMQKYRQHTQKQIEDTKLEFDKLQKGVGQCCHRDKIEKQARVIDRLVSMMRDFMDDGSALTNQLLSQNAKLKAENDCLRKMLSMPSSSASCTIAAKREKKKKGEEEEEQKKAANTTVLRFDEV